MAEPSAAGAASHGAPGPDGHTQEGSCLNCGTALVGPHCHQCGQRGHVHRTIGAFFHDLMHGVLHFEGKLWRTLPVLLWQPGKLTRDYINGQRARYISPIALFLFMIFLTFALISAAGGIGEADPSMDMATEAEIVATIGGLDRQVAAKSNARSAGNLTAAEVAELDVEIAALEQERGYLRQLASLYEDAESPSAGDGAIQIDERASGGDKAAGWLVNSWKKAKANPNLLLYKLQNNSYKLSWLLIPLSLPFMWLLFPFSTQFRMYDHTVFVTYSIAFMTFLMILVSAAQVIGAPQLAAIPLLYAPFHLYRQLKGAYGLSRRGAVWRMGLLSAFIWVVLALFLLIMLGIVIS